MMRSKSFIIVIVLLTAGAFGASLYFYTQLQKLQADILSLSDKPSNSVNSTGPIKIDYAGGQSASATSKGFLTALDWTTFNNKADSSDLLKFSYKIDRSDLSTTVAGLTYSSITGIFSLETGYVIPTTIEVASWNSVSSNNHVAVTLGNANGLSLSGQQLSLALASGGVSGALSGGDWATFNSKQSAGAYLTAESDTLASVTGRGATTNSRIGLGTASPAAALDVQTGITAASGTAYGARLQQTLTASGDNDILTALYINPTFSNGLNSGVANNGLVIANGSFGVGTTTTPPVPSAPTATVATNLVLNPGFETAGSPTFQNWTNIASDGSISNETSLIHSGGHAAKLTQGASNGTKLYTSSFAVSANTLYNVSFWTAGDGTHAGQYYIRDVSNSNIIQPYTGTNISGTAYAHFTTSFTTPAGCTSVYIMFTAPGSVTGAVAYFDDVAISSQQTGSIADGTYYYTLSALNSANESLRGAESSATVVSNGGFGSSVILSWPAVTGATSYRIYRTSVSGTYTSPSFIGNSITNSYTDVSTSTSSGAPSSSASISAGAATIYSSGVVNSTGLVSPYIKPVNDSTTAVQIQTSNGSSLMNFDTTNGTVTLKNLSSGGITSFVATAGNGQGSSPVATFNGNISLGGIASPTAPTVALGAAGALNGSYNYMISFITGVGETGVVYGANVSATVNPVNQKVVLTNIPISAEASATSRNVFRTKTGVPGTYYYVGTINDNSTTTYTDNTTDANLGDSNHYQSSGLATSGAIYAGGHQVFKDYGVGLAVGQDAGINMTQWDNNTLIGDFAGVQLSTASYATIVGAQAGRTMTSANGNSFFGGKSGYSTSGGGNTFLGANSGFSTSTGTNNVFIGENSGDAGTTPGTNANKTGSYNTFIGYYTGPGTTTQLSYAGAIGYSTVVNASNLINIGASNQAVGINFTASSFGTNNKFLVNNFTTADNNAVTMLSSGAATYKGLVVQGFAAQSANLQEWQASDGTILSFVSSAGVIQAAGYKSSDSSTGLSLAVTVKGSDSNNCLMTFKNGLLTASTCP